MKTKQHGLLYKIFTSNFGTIGYVDVRRLLLLNTFLIIGILAFTLFGLFNTFIENNYLIAFMNLFCSIALTCCFFYLRIYKNESFVITISSIVVIIFMIFFISINGNKDFGLIWSFFTPMFLIPLNGHKKGLKLSLAFYFLAVFSILFNLNNWTENGWDELVLIRFVVASLMVIFVMYMSEYTILKLQKELQHISSTDSLTSLFNRGKIEETVKKEFEKKREKNTQIAIVMIDVDDFKQINDNYGHHIGDKILKEIATLLSSSIRSIDTIGRWGGEEFLMVLPDVCMNNGLSTIKRLQDKIDSYSFTMGIKITCSFGICCVDKNDFKDEEAIIAADNALYKAKNSGKNKVCTVALT